MLKKTFVGFLAFWVLTGFSAYASPPGASCQPFLHDIDNTSGILMRQQAYDVIFSREHCEYAWQDASFMHYSGLSNQDSAERENYFPYHPLTFDFKNLANHNIPTYLKKWTQASPVQRARLIEDVLEVQLLPEDFSVEILRGQRGI